jgi:hypothetical protein
LHGRHRVQEARRQTAEPAIAQPRVWFLFQQFHSLDAFDRGGVSRDRFEQQVRDVVIERSSDQELHRQVIDALGVLAVVGLFCPHPSLREHIAHRAGEGLEPLAAASGVQGHDVVEQQVPVVQPVIRLGELNGPAPVLLKQRRRQRSGFR